MKKSKIIPTSTEARFDLSEMFFSKTDTKGIIQFGNTVFARVSGYNIEQMLGRPHNMIRHPDMPKSVFRLMWNDLLQGKPIAAYVKNMASDGSYYWVLALVSLSGDEFVSVRIKPTTEFFKKTQSIYKEVLVFETNHSIDESLQFLLEKIKAAGFDSYKSFQSQVVFEEIRSRWRGLKATSQTSFTQVNRTNTGHSNSGSAVLWRVSKICKQSGIRYSLAFDELKKTLSVTAQLSASTHRVLEQCRQLGSMVINMAISADKIGESGRTLADVAIGFEKFSQEISVKVNELETYLNDSIHSLASVQFAMGAASLQSDVTDVYIREVFDNKGIGTDANQSQGLVDVLTLEIDQSSMDTTGDFLKVYRVNIDNTSREVSKLFAVTSRLLQIAGDLETAVIGLEVIRLSASVESTRVTGEVSFVHHVKEMFHFISSVKDPVKTVVSSIVELQANVYQVRRAFWDVQHELAQIESVWSSSVYTKSKIKTHFRKAS